MDEDEERVPETQMGGNENDEGLVDITIIDGVNECLKKANNETVKDGGTSVDKVNDKPYEIGVGPEGKTCDDDGDGK